MEISVTSTEVTITESNIINQGEYNIHQCNFTFSTEYNNLTKRAIFTTLSKYSYLVEIENDSCIIPQEILQYPGQVYLGVYGYENNPDDTLRLRYSPQPTTFNIINGSYIENSKPTIPPSKATDLMQMVEELVTEIQEKLDRGEFNGKDGKDGKDGTGIARIVFNADYTMTVTLTNGVTVTSQSLQGQKGDKGEAGTTNYDELDNKPTKLSDFTNDSGFITRTVNNLTNYELRTNTGSLIELSLDHDTYIITLNLKNQDGNIISSDTIDLPLESVVVNARFDSINRMIILVLENGNEISFSVADLVSGLQTEITNVNKLASDLVDDTNSGNKFVTTSEKQSWNVKYNKPIAGIPKTDLAGDVQTSLTKADSAIQAHQDITGKVDKSAFVYDETTETLTITI